MATLTELVATVVLQSSAVAYSHFGVTLEPVRLERPMVAERTVARSPLTPPKESDRSVAPAQARDRAIKA